MFYKQVWVAVACTVRKSTETIFHVDDAVVSIEEQDDACTTLQSSFSEPQGDLGPRTYTVVLETGIFSHCADRHHRQLP
ncbi:hypothetical protein JG688_00008123 [Phytophthora aleatoria]|uniref:Uncharacterized protein n=1 Tax=Phytophthora aleatoria TaxID=2496075 RepID=A0A8J5MG95_9STRA|nr:hypothetical protein JG688_00008123 [Phytophthora aleatoria]